MYWPWSSFERCAIHSRSFILSTDTCKSWLPWRKGTSIYRSKAWVGSFFTKRNELGEVSNGIRGKDPAVIFICIVSIGACLATPSMIRVCIMLDLSGIADDLVDDLLDTLDFVLVWADLDKHGDASWGHDEGVWVRRS